MPTSNKTLSYKSHYDMHDNYVYIERNHRLVERLSGTLMREKDNIVSDYFWFWRNPKSLNTERLATLKPLLLENGIMSELSDGLSEELKLLLLEAAAQRSIRERAKQKLIKWFKDLYDLSDFAPYTCL